MTPRSRSASPAALVADLAFMPGPLADASRIGIPIGSAGAGVIGYLVLKATFPPPRGPEAARISPAVATPRRTSARRHP